MSDYEGLEPLEKQVSLEQQLSVQERATRDVEQGGMGLSFMLMADTGSHAPYWWSWAREHYLARTWQECPLYSGAVFNIAAKLATIPPIIEPRDPSLKSERDRAENFAVRLYEGSEFGVGWLEFAMKWFQSRWNSDNGAFGEVLGRGPKDGPIVGMPVGLANLDSNRCSRTANPEWPVMYTQAGTGKKYKLHRSRVIYGSQLPSNRDEMNGVGLCWFSRAMGVAQSIVDDLTYKQEKLGGRPKRGILVGKKVSVSMVQAAFEMADEAADSAGTRRYGSFVPIVANETAADVGIDVVDLASLPDGFEWETDVNLAMYIIALTGGFPVRWMWPATAVGATKADALLQHMATAMSGTAYELGTLSLLLAGSERGSIHRQGKFLPPTLKMRFDVPDDWIDQVQAEIQETRSRRWERNLGDLSLTVRVAREQMLASGEITEAQFRDMELKDGRTQDGLPVDVLFYGDNPYLQGIDPDEASEEQIKAKLKEAKRASVTENGEQKNLAKEAVRALEWLLEPEEEEQPPQAAKPHQDAPERGAPSMTSTGVTEAASASSEKERTPIENKMRQEINRAFRDFAPEAENAVKNGEEPDYEPLRTALVTVLMTFLIRAFMDRLMELEEEYDIAFDPAETGALANEWAATYAPQEADRLIGTTEKIVSGVAARYAAEEITADQIEEMLEPAFSRNRADLIAITLVTLAASLAIENYVILLRALGLEVQEIWETVVDDRRCPACADLHGQPKGVWIEPPPLHGRCRCTVRLVIRRIQ